MSYAQLKKLSNNPQTWSKAASDLFMLNWRSTPSPKKLPSSKKSSSGFLSMFDFSGKSKKKKKKSKRKKKKGKTRRR